MGDDREWDDRPLLIVHSSDEWYGADRMVAELATLSAQSVGRSVEVWLPAGGAVKTPSLSGVLAERGITVRSVPLPVLRRRSLTPRGLLTLAAETWRLRRRLAEVHPAAVVAATSAVVPVLWALPRRTPSLLYVQEIWRSGERLVLGGLALPADALLAISEPVAAALPPVLRRRTTVVTNAVPESGTALVPPPEGQALTYVVASRWNSWKGHDLLLQAWEAAGCPGRLIILGGPPEAGIGVDVAALVAGLSRPDTVEIVGEVDDIEPWIDRADALILPSTNPEPFGLVVIEAFARGRPVIATAHGAPASVVTADVGWLTDPTDAAGLAQVFAGMDRREAARRGAMARELYKERYSMPAWRTAMSRVLERFAPTAASAGSRNSTRRA